MIGQIFFTGLWVAFGAAALVALVFSTFVLDRR